MPHTVYGQVSGVASGTLPMPYSGSAWVYYDSVLDFTLSLMCIVTGPGMSHWELNCTCPSGVYYYFHQQPVSVTCPSPGVPLRIVFGPGGTEHHPPGCWEGGFSGVTIGP
jgi:hypothetical protein